MRLLFISNYYPPYEMGGYEQLCREIALRFAAKGYEVHVLTSGRGKEGSMADAGCHIHRWLRILPDYESKISPAIQFFLRRRKDERHNLNCLQSIVAEIRPQVIFIWNIETLSKILATWAESQPDTKVAYWIAGRAPGEIEEYWRYWSYPVQNKFANTIKQTIAKLAYAIMRSEGKPVVPEMRHIAVVSHYLRQKGIRQGTLPKHTEVIYNGIEIEDFYHPVNKSETRPVRLIQAGRLSKDKGVDVSIKAVAKLINEYGLADLQLTLAGSGTEAFSREVHTLVRQANIGDHVQFIGWVPRKDLPAILHEHQILLLPTTFPEPFARSALEAMAGGLAVIASDTGGTPEIVHHGRSGLLFPPGDFDALAMHIKDLVNNPNLRVKLAAEGQQRVIARHSLDLMFEKQELLIRKAISAKA